MAWHAVIKYSCLSAVVKDFSADFYYVLQV